MRVNKFIFAVLMLVSPLAMSIPPPPKVGEIVPNVMGYTLDENYYQLKYDTGRIKVVNFFSRACVPCRQEMPELASLEKQYPLIKFISVNTQDEKEPVVSEFIKKLPAAPSHIIITTGGLQETFHPYGLPATLVLSSKNVVLLSLYGYTPENMKLLKIKLRELSK